MIRTFYAPPENFTDDERVIIKGEEAHHAIRVLRLRVGDIVRIVDGVGNAFIGEIARITPPDGLTVEIQERSGSTDPNAEIVLMVAVPRPQRMDFLIEKAVEIGVHAIFPIIYERSPRILEGKVTRWRRIAISAMKQCGRARLPEIHRPMQLHAALEHFADYDGRYVADLLDGKPLLGYNLRRKAVIAVGPEGGFTDTEIDMLDNWKFHRFTLGRRILRVETAAIVALTIFLNGLGEL